MKVVITFEDHTNEAGEPGVRVEFDIGMSEDQKDDDLLTPAQGMAMQMMQMLQSAVEPVVDRADV